MELLTDLEHALDSLDRQGLRRRRRVVETPCDTRMTVDGQALMAFCSNDYLGLAAHPQVIEALRAGARKYGAGSGASHLISGHSRAHAVLEDRLAELMSPHLEDARALYFCTGYMANLAVISGLACADTELFSESLNHASLIDGTRLARVATSVYAHGDTADLERLLRASHARNKVVLTDSVFSMDGDLAPLRDILALCEQYRAWLVVDDAHGFGVLGASGRGVLEHFGLRSPYLVYVGTLGKAAGVGGAFVAANFTVIEWLVQRARPYIYTTAASPALACALLKSLELITGREGNMRRKQLRLLIAELRASLRLQKWRLLPSDTPIQPIVIGTNDDAMNVSEQLLQKGLWVPAIRPPTVPPDTARLRVTLSASHTLKDVTRLTEELNALESEPAPFRLEQFQNQPVSSSHAVKFHS